MSHLILERPLWSLWRAVLPKVILLACLMIAMTIMLMTRKIIPIMIMM